MQRAATCNRSARATKTLAKNPGIPQDGNPSTAMHVVLEIAISAYGLRETS
jgi:hypothetical protein